MHNHTGELRNGSKSVWSRPSSREAAQSGPEASSGQKLGVVEILSQDRRSLTALNQEAEHQKQLEGIMGIGGKKMSLGEDNLSFSPRYARLQKNSAAQAVPSRPKYVVMKPKSNRFLGGWGGVSSATVVAGLVTLHPAQTTLEGSRL